MQKTTLLGLEYPDYQQEGWTSILDALGANIKAHIFSSIDFQNTVLYTEGSFSLNASENILSWDGTIEVCSLLTGFRVQVAAGSLEGILDGYCAYVVVDRPIEEMATAELAAGRILDFSGQTWVAKRDGTDILLNPMLRSVIGQPLDMQNSTSGTRTITLNGNKGAVVSIDWDDGGDVEYFQLNGSTPVAAAHTYAGAGSYAIYVGGNLKDVSSFDVDGESNLIPGTKFFGFTGADIDIENCGWSTGQIDSFLIAANDAVCSEDDFHIVTGNSARSAASDTAVSEMTGRGCTFD